MKRRNATPGTLEPKDITPEQQRLNELSKIAYERHNEAVRARQCNGGGLWFAQQYLTDDLKEEYRMLQAATQQQQRRSAA